MPKFLAIHNYPALVDFYFEETVKDPITGETIRTWRYDMPVTFSCNYLSLSGHAEAYQKSIFDSMDDIRVQLKPEDAEKVTVAMRLGNLRNAEHPEDQYYRWVGRRNPSTPYYFNISGMHPKVDGNGRIQYVEITAKLAENA